MPNQTSWYKGAARPDSLVKKGLWDWITGITMRLWWNDTG